MSATHRAAPLGIRTIEWTADKCCSQGRRIDRMTWHRAGVLGLTYLAYTCYHMTRKPISVAKNVLSQNCSGLTPPPDVTNGSDTWCDWAPFGKYFFLLWDDTFIA